MEERQVKIIKDTVSHRIPIGKIIKIKNVSDKLVRKKRCYKLVYYCCYISEDDFEVLSKNDIEGKKSMVNDLLKPVNETTNYQREKDWFQEYADNQLDQPKTKQKFKVGDKVFAENVTALTPNGTEQKANKGNYIIYESGSNSKKKIWLRRNDTKDLNEYFCYEKDLTKK